MAAKRIIPLFSTIQSFSRESGLGLIRLDTMLDGPDKDIILSGPRFEALKVWGPRVAEAVTILDKNAKAYRARVLELNSGSALLRVFERIAKNAPGAPHLTLVQSLPEKERMELIIQKTTELGVDAIVPIGTLKSTTLKEREALQKKAHRWPQIALKAAKQCRRPDIPVITEFTSFDSALKLVGSTDLKIILDACKDSVELKEALKNVSRLPKGVVVMAGPEGGFAPEETEEAKEAGFVCASMGARILRTETAAIAAIAAIRYELG